MRLVAYGVFAALGAALLLSSPSDWIRALGLGFVLGAVLRAGFLLARRPRGGWRSDPYDLGRLWDEPPAEPEEPDAAPELVYCHVCGNSSPAAFATCPECGNRLRG